MAASTCPGWTATTRPGLYGIKRPHSITSPSWPTVLGWIGGCRTLTPRGVRSPRRQAHPERATARPDSNCAEPDRRTAPALSGDGAGQRHGVDRARAGCGSHRDHARCTRTISPTTKSARPRPALAGACGSARLRAQKSPLCVRVLRNPRTSAGELPTARTAATNSASVQPRESHQ